jgi:uncharacterized protein DUF748
MKKKSRKFRFARVHKILIIIIIVLVVLRILLPYILLKYCNKSLSELKGYYGHIEDIDVSLYRGAYQINDMYLNKVGAATHKQTNFFKVNNIDLSVEWGALFHGRLVGELVFSSPKLIFTKDKTEISDVKKDTNDFRKVLKDFMPLKVNRFEVNNGSIHYVDAGATPKVDISIEQAHILAQNLKNVEDNKTELPSPVTATGNVYGGTLSLNMKLDALAQRTRFDLNAEIKNANLVSLNDFLKAYGGFDVNKGTFGLYTEFAAKNGKYKGYVKPVIKNLDVVGPEDRKDKFFQKVWENIVGAAGEILNNPKKNQIATKVPIEGDFAGSNTDIIEMIWELLRNAFIQALMPSIDNQININSLNTSSDDHKSLLQKIFGGGKDKDKKDKSKDN